MSALPLEHGRPPIRAANETPLNLELTRRLVILSHRDDTADSEQSTAVIIVQLLLWALAAGAAWLVMLLLGN
ncbi:MAG: hypothetical protein ACRYGI_20400 [Janthinobacterium lividum]